MSRNGSKPPDDERICLHCFLWEAIHLYHEAIHMTTPDGAPILNVSTAVGHLTEVLAEVIGRLPNKEFRDELLDDAIRSLRQDVREKAKTMPSATMMRAN